ncbi:hypothetical protein [Mangrovicoccus ximenensis]|uniref:hypothetical protein n=1 Tax=Mangrovicoccus ximenensis TaxID=1911570 RepID=UPI0011AE68B5|nr:hypothetical protein [Mangrovicoccus ximenensis]
MLEVVSAGKGHAVLAADRDQGCASCAARAGCGGFELLHCAAATTGWKRPLCGAPDIRRAQDPELAALFVRGLPEA